jgi:hypothetical protein
MMMVLKEPVFSVKQKVVKMLKGKMTSVVQNARAG